MAKTNWNVRGLAINPVDVTPSDDDLNEFELLYIGVAGDLVFTPYGQSDAEVRTLTVDVGWFPVPVTKVWEATTADEIVGWQQG